ncbi:hypothetical protein Enr8_42250 [Blastopirellula retiformator]|uniref:SGNH hydrolase-type esterase domain-containing protein n=2 Tax=Blastopirellula retiformator TaxID=2527970 RepID=A0A5C5UYY7_9BACT|nr:hypothetical protein Enr8_42250 [Blastopirellula retiformator]
MGVGLTKKRSGTAFDPLSLSGLACLCDDQSVRATQADGTVPVTADGQYVRYWQDRSGNDRSPNATGFFPSSLTIGTTPAIRFGGIHRLSADWTPGDLNDFSTHWLAKSTRVNWNAGLNLRNTSTSATAAHYPDVLDRMRFGTSNNGHLRYTSGVEPHLFSVVRESEVIKFYFDGILFHTAANTDTVTPQTIRFPQEPSSGTGQWDLLMLAVATAAHSQADITSMVSYYRAQMDAYARPAVGAIWLSNSLGTAIYTITTGSLPYLVQLETTGVDDVTNYSLTGKKTPEMIADFDEVATKLIAIPEQAVVVVFEGTNDIRVNGISGATAAANLFSLCDTIRAAHPAAKIVLVTLIDRYDVDHSILTACNDILKADWPDHADALADLTGIAAVSAENAASDPTNFVDGIHLSEIGQLTITGTIAAAIESALAS